MNDTRPLSPADVAAELGVSKDTVLRWIRDGKLPAARLGYRTLRIRRQDLDAFLRSPPATAPDSDPR
jgi:excisionase family DNA binding protein